MVAKQVAYIGCSFSGTCSKKGHGSFTGTFSANGSPVISLNDKNVCVTGTTGQASCGCTVMAIGNSTSFKLNGKNVARVGDAVVEASVSSDGTATQISGGSITGVITSGAEWLSVN